MGWVLMNIKKQWLFTLSWLPCRISDSFRVAPTTVTKWSDSFLVTFNHFAELQVTPVWCYLLQEFTHTHHDAIAHEYICLPLYLLLVLFSYTCNFLHTFHEFVTCLQPINIHICGSLSLKYNPYIEMTRPLKLTISNDNILQLQCLALYPKRLNQFWYPWYTGTRSSNNAVLTQYYYAYIY